MSKLKQYFLTIFFAVCLTLGGSFFIMPASVEAANNTFSGNVVNNVVFVDFSDSSVNSNYLNETPSSYYSNDVLTVMDRTYNTGVSSVKEYYDTISYGKLKLNSNFYKNSNLAYKVPYTKNQLCYYSDSNPTGYLQYEAVSYSGSSVPSEFSINRLKNTTHLFSFYDCSDSNHPNTYHHHDNDASDNIVCKCYYDNYIQSHSNVTYYDHLESLLREHISLKYVLNQISSMNGNLDSNSDGNVDALTFIFPEASGVEWSDLLWAHQSSLYNFSSYSSYKSLLPTYLANHGVRGVDSNQIDVLLKSYSYSGKTCASYNLYLLSDLIPTGRKLTDTAGEEVVSSFTLAHELGHIFGLPDYYVYDTDYDNGSSSSAVSFYDLMSFNYYGVPMYMATYNRQLMGFTNSNNVIKLDRAGTYELYPTCYDELYNGNSNSNNVLAFYYEDTEYSGQKIYFEYRLNEGNFEGGLKGLNFSGLGTREEGLIMYRVDESVKQVSGYNDLLSPGNFFGYPYNLEIFRNGDTQNKITVLNNLKTSYNKITFQSYNTSKNQSTLTKNDVTFTNSGLKISNVKIENGKLSFKIEGGKLLAANIDTSAITLKGSSSINHEVKTSYTDAGINFGSYSSSDFSVSYKIYNNSNVEVGNSFINNLGIYTYVYTITYTPSGQTFTLTRTITIKDTTAPIVTLKVSTEAYVTNINKFKATINDINYSDNYDSKSALDVAISNLSLVSGISNRYKVTYTVTDSSGNFASVTKYITDLQINLLSITLNGLNPATHEVKTQYLDAGINWGLYNKNNFTVDSTNNVNTLVLGGYSYIYKITHTLTGEEIILTRTVNVVDTTAPTITLIGESIIEKYLSEAKVYDDNNFAVSDNYDSVNNISVSKRIAKETDSEYRLYYKAIDNSGNESEEIYRTIKIISKPIQNSQIILQINDKRIIEEYFTNSDVTFKVNINKSEDNLIDPVIKFYINDEEVKSTSYGELTYRFKKSGYYTIKIEADNAVQETDIIVQQAVVEINIKTELLVLIGIVSILFIIIIVFVTLKSKAKKIKSNLDKY